MSDIKLFVNRTAFRAIQHDGSKASAIFIAQQFSELSFSVVDGTFKIFAQYSYIEVGEGDWVVELEGGRNFHTFADDTFKQLYMEKPE
jgi:hypothetical protein